MNETDKSAPPTLFTIGFTKKTAENFFNTLKIAGVTKIIDTRLNNVSQLAGFSKKDDLRYFLKAILGADYIHVLDFAPTDDILSAYKKKEITWDEYESRFRELIGARHIENVLTIPELDKACLLCSEAQPHHCHRRLVAEYLQAKFVDLHVNHL
jgi:uncharacterized protein (DUF488 family)